MTRGFAALFLASAIAWGQAAQSGPKVTVRLFSGAETEHSWTDDRWLEKTIHEVSEAGGGIFEFAPGVYEFARGMMLKRVNHIHFRGSPGTVFRSRPMTELGEIRVSKGASIDDGSFEVDRPDLMRPHTYYRLFRPDLKGNRILEFETGEIEGSRVHVKSKTNAQVRTLEPGMLVIPALTFVQGWECGDMSFMDIEFDGNLDVSKAIVNGHLIHGHTLHCGVLLMNRYVRREGEPPLPGTRNLRVQRCVFRRILGRGVTAYNMHHIRVVDCRFEDVGAEGLEADHLATDVVIRGCSFIRNKIGMRLNDCTDTIVNGNVFRRCRTGVQITRVVKDDSLNRRLSITGNTFDTVRRGIGMDHAADSVIANNVISGAETIGIELRGQDVSCTDNLIVGCKRIGILVFTDGCSHAGNTIRPAAGVTEFVPVKRQDG